MQLQTKMRIIETVIIFCCRLGFLIFLIEKIIVKARFYHIDIAATTNEDDNYRISYILL